MTSRPLGTITTDLATLYKDGFTDVEIILPDGRVIGTSRFILALRSPLFRRHFRQNEQSLSAPSNATDDISSLPISSSNAVTTDIAATPTDTLTVSPLSQQSPLRLEDYIQPLYLPRDSLAVAFEKILSFFYTDVLDWDENNMLSSPVTADFLSLSTSAPGTPLYSPTSTVVPSLPASPITSSFPSSPVTPVTPSSPSPQLLHNSASSLTDSNLPNPPTLLASLLLISYRLELLPLLSHLESNFKSYLDGSNTVPLLNAFIQMSTHDSCIPSSPDLSSLLTISTRFSGMCYRYLHAKSAFDDEEGFNTYKLGELKFKSVVFCLRLRRAYLDGQKEKPRGKNKGKGRVLTEGASRDKGGEYASRSASGNTYGSGYRHLLKGENGEVRTLKFIERWIRYRNSDGEARRGAVNEEKQLRTNKDNASVEERDRVNGREKNEIAVKEDKITCDAKEYCKAKEDKVEADKTEGNEAVIEKADACTLETDQADQPTMDAVSEVDMKADKEDDSPIEKEIAENGNMMSDNDNKSHPEAMSITESASDTQTEQSQLGIETQKESDVAENDTSQDSVKRISEGSNVGNEEVVGSQQESTLEKNEEQIIKDGGEEQEEREEVNIEELLKYIDFSYLGPTILIQMKQSAFIPHHILVDAIEVKWREEAVRCIQEMKQELDICRAREKKLIESLMEERNRADGVMVALLRLLIIVLMGYGVWYVFSLVMVRLPKALKRY
ncbi:6446_t:CDS:2 [Paraglomus brasilianum]|uniref:6446_t:CDS:1 n=1 Tax=Paraglomus brasilianum TaxID=144538 RepID=A0A9N9C8H6_9GLOM|nr:6446_t:CDS:2 [Paraglomus brasilianum]